MGFLKLLSMATETYLGVKTVQSGSDWLINRHTEINMLKINSRLRAHANKLIERYFKNTFNGPLNEYEAAILKLGIFFTNIEHDGDDHTKELIMDGIRKIRNISEGKIRVDIAIEVMAKTGA